MWTEKDKTVNWVARRGICVTAFKVLSNHIKHDVDEMNKLLATGDSRYKFEINTTSRKFTVCKLLDGDCVDQIYFRNCKEDGNENEITVHIDERNAKNISYSWDPDESVCKFAFNGNPCELWQISQEALLDLFFSRIDL